MRIITARDTIRGVADRWKEQYLNRNGTRKIWYDLGKEAVHKALIKLDLETATAEQVEKIIGNGSWVGLKCDQCKKKVDFTVEVGEEPDYESSTACLCKKCLYAAVKLVKSVKA